MSERGNERDEPADAEDDIDVPPVRPWATRTQVVAAVLWPSFLAACFATMLFFAFVDPGVLHDDTAPRIETTRMTAYGIAFFFFWVICAISSAVTAYLIRTSHITDREQDGAR